MPKPLLIPALLFITLSTALLAPTKASAEVVASSPSMDLQYVVVAGGGQAQASGAFGQTQLRAASVGPISGATASSLSGVQLGRTELVVPEPAMVSALLVGLLALFAGARHRLARDARPCRGLCKPGLFLAFSAILLVAGWSTASVAQVPSQLRLSGELTDPTGQPLVGPVSIQVRIYDAYTSGSLLFLEDHASVPLDLNGRFSLAIGSGAIILGAISTDLFDHPSRVVELVIDGELLEPRLQLASVPYAMQTANAAEANLAATALWATHAGNAATLEGVSLSELIAMIPSAWSDEPGQLSTTGSVVIGTPSETPTSKLFVDGTIEVLGDILLGAEGTPVQTAIDSVESLANANASNFAALAAALESVCTAAGGTWNTETSTCTAAASSYNCFIGGYCAQAAILWPPAEYGYTNIYDGDTQGTDPALAAGCNAFGSSTWLSGAFVALNAHPLSVGIGYAMCQ